MADDDSILKTIRELQQIPKDIHLFCPATDPAASTYPETSEATNDAAANARVNKFFSALQILAYNGDDAQPYQQWIYDKLDEELGNCASCIRNYYQRQKSWQQELLTEYEAEEVDEFLDIIRRREIARITRGLDGAKEKLEKQPESNRDARALADQELYALFEALHCEAFFGNETLMQTHFDQPFKLVQTRRALKVTDLLPAVTFFLFSDNKDRLDWALATWQRLNRSPTDDEWDWAIRDAFKTEIDKVRNDQEFIRYWSALAQIVPKLSPEQTRQKLFDVGMNFARLCLDNLARNTAAVAFIVRVLKKIFTDTSDAFFQALVSVSATTVAEQIFGSPQFDNLVKLQAGGQRPELDMLSWSTAFIDGLPPANRPAAARTLAFNLHERMTKKKTTDESADLCCSWLIKVLTCSVLTFSNDDQVRAAMDRNVISDALETVSKYLGVTLLHKSSHGSEDSTKDDINLLVRNTLALECQCLRDDFDSLQSLSKPSSTTFHTPQIWQTSLDHLQASDHQFSAAIIKGTIGLVGLESLRVTPASKYAKEMEIFNIVFGKIEQFMSRFVERLTEFPPEHLDPLFMNQDTNMGLMALLFSGNENIYQATVDMIKNLSGDSGRTEALTHLLSAFFGPTLFSICWTFRRISNKKAFTPIPRLLKTGRDIMNILCDTTGLLRRDVVGQKDIPPVQSYWSYSWMILGTIFTNMEKWSTEVHNKSMMTDVCRDTMQYAKDLFGHYYLFLKVLQQGKDPGNAPQTLLSTDGKSTSGSPPKTLDAMTKWLRLKDEYLAENLVGLITMLLKRLKEYGTVIPEDSPAIAFTMDAAGVAETAKPVKTALTENQKAELVRALEQYLDKRLKKEPVLKRQSRLDSWTDSSNVRSNASTPRSDVIALDGDMGDALSDSDGLQKPRRNDVEHQKIQSATSQKPKPREQQTRPSLAKPSMTVITEKERQIQTTQQKNAFIQQRKAADAERKARDRLLAARLRGQMSTDQTANAGSGLSALGVAGKDHSLPRSEMMVSSESESDSGDEELFGAAMPSSRPARAALSNLRSNAPAVQMPKRVRKVQRSVTDMRARLAPDLTNLHKTILSWDFFSDTDTPPNSDRSDYSLVSNTFKSVEQYQRTFEPLLILEGWQSLRSAREEGQFKPFEIKVASSLIVDNFFEINTSMNMAEGRDLGLAPSDVVLLSKGDRPHAEPTEPHCLARVKEITRKRGEMHITFRVVSSNPLRPHLHDKSTIYGVSILSLTPLEREFGALSALQYYDLAKEIVQAEPSPLLDYPEREIKPIQDLYKVNEAQAKAVKSAIDNDAFTLVQGPPGSGKTKTICAIVGALLTESMKRSAGGSLRPPVNGRPVAASTSKKLLVCAPSNAAVDELVMRFKDGIRLMDGSSQQVNVVRLGRSEAINASVKDVTLEELVSARLNNNLPGVHGKEDIQSVMMEHKKVSGDLVELRDKLNALRAEGQGVDLQDEQALDALRRKKLALGSKIDELREKQNSANRDAEINRRRVQQEILDSAHVLCATLSGSGHEMFQNMNVEFETVIIDEAAQSIELSALIPLKYGCLKCILVGDPKQLPPTVLSRQAAKYQYEQSLFARMEKNHKKNVHLLDVQYRMHPEISVFPSRTFYDSKLRDGDNMARLRARPWHRSEVLSPYRFFDVQGVSTAAKAGRSLVNKAEIEVAMQLYERLTTDVPRYNFHGKVGIITPYKGQLKELKQMFTMRYGEQITSAVEFNTTDAFQGRESEVIIFSCVRASTQGIGFLRDVRRMNVGLTRAKCSLWVLGNSQSLIQGEFWKALVTDAQSRNLYSDGDILQLLRRPLLNKHMMMEDVFMDDVDAPYPNSGSLDSTVITRNDKGEQLQTGTRIATTKSAAITTSRKDLTHARPTLDSRRSSNASLPQSRASAEGSRSSSIAPQAREKDSRPTTPSLQGQMPSGGRSGLNTNANCATCGSHSHKTAACDNQEARTQRFGKCSRCQQTGHGHTSCQAPRCLGCGVFGHLEEQCSQPFDTRLDLEARRHVSKQETDFTRVKDKVQQSKTEARQQKDAAVIPTVKSTVPINQNGSIVTQGEKRKRENPPLRDDLPKMLPASRAGGPGPIRQPGPLGSISQSGASQQPIIRKKKPREQDMFANKRR